MYFPILHYLTLQIHSNVVTFYCRIRGGGFEVKTNRCELGDSHEKRVQSCGRCAAGPFSSYRALRCYSKEGTTNHSVRKNRTVGFKVLAPEPCLLEIVRNYTKMQEFSITYFVRSSIQNAYHMVNFT